MKRLPSITTKREISMKCSLLFLKKQDFDYNQPENKIVVFYYK